MNFIKLLVAAKVREIAIELREADRKFSFEPDDQFDAARPLASYAALALHELRDFDSAISAISTTWRAAPNSTPE